MKKSRKSEIVFFVIAIVVIVVSIFLLKKFDSENFNENLIDFCWDAIKTVFSTIVIGFIVKLVGEHLLEVKKNNKKLNELGIYSIGGGKLPWNEECSMFGCPSLGYPYPKKMKMMFYTGVKFIEHYKDKMIQLLKNGCEIQILVADEEKSKGFLERYELAIPQNEPDYGNSINQLKMVDDFVKEIREAVPENRDKISIRNYVDEYRYNIRMTYYENSKTKLWANFSSLKKDAVDLSLMIMASTEYYDGDELNREKSFVLKNEEFFDELWERYKETNH